MKNMRPILPSLLWLCVALLIGCNRHAAPVPPGSALTVAISTNHIRIGDLIHLRLTSVHPTNLHLNPPDLAHGKDIIVRDRVEGGARLPDGRVCEVVDYAITSLVTGNHIIATSPGIVWARPDGTTTQAPFPFVAFQVHSMLSTTNADLSNLRDIHDLARWPDRIPRWLLAVLIAIAVIAAGGWLLRRYLTHAHELACHAPPPPPHEVALAALQALLTRDWIEQRQIEAFYVELSAIARRYLEARFRLHAPEETTEEFLREAATAGALSPEHQHLVAQFLEQSDLVKFAQHQPGPDDMRAAHAAAERLVRETIPTADKGQPATVTLQRA